MILRRITKDLEGNLSIGILGGSFNPAHRGHLEVTDAARYLLRLDRCWWLVTPGNPLKAPEGYKPLQERLEGAHNLARGRPWLSVSDIERSLGTCYTFDTLTLLRNRFPQMRPVWLMGADSLTTFHKWRDWEQIARLMPIAVISRPGYELAALKAPAAQSLAKYRLPAQRASVLSRMPAPAWIFLSKVHNPLSSTAIRNQTGP